MRLQQVGRVRAANDYAATKTRFDARPGRRGGRRSAFLSPGMAKAWAIPRWDEVALRRLTRGARGRPQAIAILRRAARTTCGGAHRGGGPSQDISLVGTIARMQSAGALSSASRPGSVGECCQGPACDTARTDLGFARSFASLSRALANAQTIQLRDVCRADECKLGRGSGPADLGLGALVRGPRMACRRGDRVLRLFDSSVLSARGTPDGTRQELLPRSGSMNFFRRDRGHVCRADGRRGADHLCCCTSGSSPGFFPS